ncbi:MAG: hypothetical protein ACRD0K_13785 [Egibacteraceae bacterium]
MKQITSTAVSRPPTVTAAAVLIFGSALWTALLSIGHLGVDIPLISALGPGGNRVVLSAGIVFALATAVQVAIGIGLTRMRPWAWTAGVVVNALALLGGITEFRGAGSVIGMVLSAAVLVLLLTPQARDALRGTYARKQRAGSA